MLRRIPKVLVIVLTLIFILTQAGTVFAVTSFVNTAKTDTTASFSWTLESESTTGMVYSPAGLNAWAPAQVQGVLTGASTSATVYGLLPDTSYDFKVTTDLSPLGSLAQVSLTTNPVGGGGAVAVNPTDAVVTMAPGNTNLSADNKFVINVNNATVSSSVYVADLIITGLPSGLYVGGVAKTGNAIEITIAGTAGPAVSSPATMNITVKGSAVTNPGMSNSVPAVVTVNPAGGGGGGALVNPVWRYDFGMAPPPDPGAYHPFDFDPGSGLTLYWLRVMDGGTPASNYKIYRVPDSSANWNDPATWGTPIANITSADFTTTTVNSNTVIVYSNPLLLSGTDPGMQYRFGIKAENGSNYSGISNIPYPFRVPGASLTGMAWFMLRADEFITGKYERSH